MIVNAYAKPSNALNADLALVFTALQMGGNELLEALAAVVNDPACPEQLLTGFLSTDEYAPITWDYTVRFCSPNAADRINVSDMFQLSYQEAKQAVERYSQLEHVLSVTSIRPRLWDSLKERGPVAIYQVMCFKCWISVADLRRAELKYDFSSR